MIAFFLLNTLVVVAIVLFHQEIADRYEHDIWPGIFPAAALLGLGAAWWFVRRGEDFRAFLASSAMIALLLISGGIGIYPNLIISTINPDYDLTIFNSASADNTLVICLIFAIIGIPFVLAYTTGVYYIFRGKTVVDTHGY
jgi:cytochrome d ubiquinol oxidase subunit II